MTSAPARGVAFLSLTLALALGLAAPQPVAAAASILVGVAYPATIEGSGRIVGTPGADVIVGSDGPRYHYVGEGSLVRGPAPWTGETPAPLLMKGRDTA